MVKKSTVDTTVLTGSTCYTGKGNKRVCPSVPGSHFFYFHSSCFGLPVTVIHQGGEFGAQQTCRPLCPWLPAPPVYSLSFLSFFFGLPVTVIHQGGEFETQ